MTGMRIFCRDLCLSRKEPLAGMGNAAKRYALLPWPRGDWRSPREDSVGMPSVLSYAIGVANAEGIHVSLVSEPAGEQRRALTCDGISIPFSEPEEAAQLLMRLARGEMPDGERDDRITILCCADSKHDACCARHGFATWKALVAAADPQKFRILQTTHLGGCRFAASIVVLPGRHRYGRIEPQQAAEFLRCLEAGVPFLPGHRGNPALSEVDQVLEHAAAVWAAEKGVEGQARFTLSPLHACMGREMYFDAEIAGRRLNICLQRTSFPLNGNCRSIVATPPQREVQRWVAVSVKEVAVISPSPSEHR